MRSACPVSYTHLDVYKRQEFTAHAVYSEMPVTGSFACGNADVDQLGISQKLPFWLHILFFTS